MLACAKKIYKLYCIDGDLPIWTVGLGACVFPQRLWRGEALISHFSICKGSHQAFFMVPTRKGSIQTYFLEYVRVWLLFLLLRLILPPPPSPHSSSSRRPMVGVGGEDPGTAAMAAREPTADSVWPQITPYQSLGIKLAAVSCV